MAGNKVVLEFAGDATKLAKEAARSSQAVDSFGDSVSRTAQDVRDAQAANEQYVSKMDRMGDALTNAGDSFSALGDVAQGFADIQTAASDKIQKQERALNDVRQAQEDYNQALRDGKQATLDIGQAAIDLEQATLDEKTALEEYNNVVREHGINSNEAKQAKLDLKQAGQDIKQAEEDHEQAIRDTEQATIDAKTAQLDLNDAQKEADPSALQETADQIERYTPLLSGLLGIFALVTAAQWLWNAAQLASPMTWIILGIIALVAGIVILIKNWDKVKEAGGKAWKWIKDKAEDTWNWIKKIPGWLVDRFKDIGKAISGPFKAAFNWIADAWNNTIGALSWSVPGWVPGIGGNSINVPDIPKFHNGGTVPGAPGSEMLAILQAGEKVTPAGRSGHSEMANVTVKLDSEVLVEALTRVVRRNGGNVQEVLGGKNA